MIVNVIIMVVAAAVNKLDLEIVFGITFPFYFCGMKELFSGTNQSLFFPCA